MLESLGYAVGGGSDFDYDRNEKRESPRSFLPDFIEHAKIHGKVGYLTRGSAEDAENQAQELASLLDRARALADRRPEIQQFQYDAAVLARLAGEDALAETYYRRTVALAPERVDATLALSDLLVARGNYKGAYQQLDAAIRAGADPIRPHVNLATALARRGDWEEALRRLRDALGEYPDAQPLGAALASILMQAKRYDEALLECVAALRKHPRSVGLHLLKVDILIAADRTTDATTALAAALEAHPSNPALLARKRRLEGIN